MTEPFVRPRQPNFGSLGNVLLGRYLDEYEQALEAHLGCSIEEAKEFIELGKTFAASHQHNKPTCGNTVTDNDKWRFTG